ncbi:protein adenylyltransferase SelO [Rothia kristinae]|uniref:protein adenylyltransferase SelO n=1 Tax=Rothia kristinae TaxID=37923 RepID=UPI0024484105|nr:protein adenylyltransferase SelO family protein [Rothia kristinae]WGH09451.1 protein adenylyltransferase SelO family protein [Rothia kristinae]
MRSSFLQDLPELGIAWRAQSAPAPRSVLVNDGLAAQLGLDPQRLRTRTGAALLTGTDLPAGTRPAALAYAGHQFGGWSPRLGDGRALLLGDLPDAAAGFPEAASPEAVASPGPAAPGDAADADVDAPARETPDPASLRELHLKGIGRTPFARGGADGNAVLGPMLREHVVGEFLHAVGIPTTRSLGVAATGALVPRPDRADPRRTVELPGAVLARVAHSHVRVGTFQYALSTGGPELVRRLAHWCITRHHPEAADAANPPLELYRRVVFAQARLVAAWEAVGFVHGVMNTDNMALSGQGIDYGPCAFLDAHDPDAVFSSIDRTGRYPYRNQAAAAQWNLARCAEALLPVLDAEPDRAVDLAQEALAEFPPAYEAERLRLFAARIGLRVQGEAAAPSTAAAVEDLLGLMAQHAADHTDTFGALIPVAESGDPARADGHGSRGARPRAERAAEGTRDEPGADPSPDPGLAADPRFREWLARWHQLGPDPALMRRSAPRVVPRNHALQEALDAAEAGEIGPVLEILDAVSHPFEHRPGNTRLGAPSGAQTRGFTTYCGT